MAGGRAAGGRVPGGRAAGRSRWRLGRPANGTRWSTGRRIARPTSGDDAPRSRLAQPPWRPGARPGGARPSGARPSGCGPGACGPSGTRSGGARPGWAGSSAARPSLARSPVAAPLLAGGRDLRLWRGARGHAGRAFAVRRIRARSLGAGLPEPGDAGGLPVDGVLSPATRSVVRSFQQRENLRATGIVGPDTEEALKRACAGGAPAAPADDAAAAGAPAGDAAGGDAPAADARRRMHRRRVAMRPPTRNGASNPKIEESSSDFLGRSRSASAAPRTGSPICSAAPVAHASSISPTSRTRATARASAIRRRSMRWCCTRWRAASGPPTRSSVS